MTVRSNVSNRELNYENRSEVSKALESIFLTLRGESETWAPVVQGGTTAGVPTYTSGEQYGYYFRQEHFVDLYFSVAWSGHTGAGDLQIVTPFTAQRFYSDLWIGEVESSIASTFPTGRTYLNTRINQNSNIIEIVASGTAVTSSLMQLATTGSFKGHVRFPIQLDQTRG